MEHVSRSAEDPASGNCPPYFLHRFISFDIMDVLHLFIAASMTCQQYVYVKQF